MDLILGEPSPLSFLPFPSHLKRLQGAERAPQLWSQTDWVKTKLSTLPLTCGLELFLCLFSGPCLSHRRL